ncbi:hypothetical protein BH11PSE5_BH11PSE5_26610 [soil metagenome]
MTDIFISYARPDERFAQQAAEALRVAGYDVWRDDELPAHRAYSDVIEERIKAAKAVLVLWSNDAVRSQWVRAEADAAREAGTLVQVSLDGVMPPMPFNQIQCADLFGWTGDTNWSGWRKVESSISTLAGMAAAVPQQDSAARPARRTAICVAPFVNMSGDAEQEYFSDGISEDIIIDLSKVSALTTIPRNAAFALKGKPIDVDAIARDHNATHVLEGSVRKAGARVRITAELIDCSNNEQLWADRYDRDLTDIFAIQDEISKAIVAALKLKLLPKEKKAIEQQRGTVNSDAYNLYLLARQHWVSGNAGDRRRDEMVVRICGQATAIDPGYAKAWALMALAQSELGLRHALPEDGLLAAERALALDPCVPEALCVKARHLVQRDRFEEARRELETALGIDPDSWEANKEMAYLIFRSGQVRESIPFFEKAVSLVDTDYHDAGMLMTCYEALGDTDSMRRAGRIAFERVEKAVMQDPTNGTAMAMGAGALGAMGDADRAREWIARTMLIDPGNIHARYNLACSLVSLKDYQGAIDLLDPYFAEVSTLHFKHTEADPDMDPLRADPRFRAMCDAARMRLGLSGETDGAS